MPAEVDDGAEAGGSSEFEEDEILDATALVDDVPLEEATAADAIAATAIHPDRGYIDCGVAPWSDKSPIGRLTYWPLHKPIPDQNMAVRCFMHPNCSLSRNRGKFSKEQVLAWLYSMRPLPPTASSEEKRAAREEHIGPRAAEHLPRAARGRATG